jgi:MYXO-CTERM domain-containing protein
MPFGPYLIDVVKNSGIASAGNARSHRNAKPDVHSRKSRHGTTTFIRCRHVRHEGVEHAVRVASNVSGVGQNGCACRVGATRAPKESFGAALALAVLLAGRSSRRRRGMNG